MANVSQIRQFMDTLEKVIDDYATWKAIANPLNTWDVDIWHEHRANFQVSRLKELKELLDNLPVGRE